ncbi:VanZ family protein [Cryptosporangium aurantiacum]|uniref:VanZ like family protein n=1 Tax=Cryptosporangium aurantiacum TaxID=134849 RepID=A0A1M7R967_9ACTN|nr:VanZ family protein [Cryptosporangium aurantiacum]SHN42701.1 VanZ like family protein [Cryptosporangium aurantiacum]
MVGGAWGNVVAVATIALVPAAGLVVALARWRTRRGSPHPWRWSFAEVGLVVGTAPWLWMILTPSGSGRSIEAVPLVGLLSQLSGEPAVAVEQIGGNLLVFAALGFCAPLRWDLRVTTVAALACAGSLAVEALQYALAIGRVTSVDDVLLNTVGATAAALSVHIMKRRQARPFLLEPGARPGRG